MIQFVLGEWLYIEWSTVHGSFDPLLQHSSIVAASWTQEEDREQAVVVLVSDAVGVLATFISRASAKPLIACAIGDSHLTSNRQDCAIMMDAFCPPSSLAS